MALKNTSTSGDIKLGLEYEACCFCSKYTKEGSDVCSTVMLQRRQRKVNLVCRSLLNLPHLLKVTQGHLKDTLAQVLPLGERSIKNVCRAWASGVKYFTLPRGGSRGGRRWSAWIHSCKSIWIFNWSERGPVPLFLVWSERIGFIARKERTKKPQQVQSG